MCTMCRSTANKDRALPDSLATGYIYDNCLTNYTTLKTPDGDFCLLYDALYYVLIVFDSCVDVFSIVTIEPQAG